MKTPLIAIFSFAVCLTALAQDGNFKLDKEYTIHPKGKIDLRSSDAKVYITGSNRSSVRVKINRTVETKGWTWGGEDFEVEVQEVNGDLRIREHQTSSNISVVGYYREDYRIDIEAPEGVSLVVRGDDGDYFIKNINGSISLSLDDADVELSDCSGDKFDIRMDDGDLRMNEGKGSIEINADDADIAIYNARFSIIEAEVDDGDLVIETTLVENGTYRIRGQDGLIALTINGGGGMFEINHDDARITAQGNFKLTDEREDRTRYRLGSGGATVRVHADDARVRLISNL